MTQPICPQCGAIVTPGSNRKYCSAHCREVAKYEAKKRDGRYEADKARKRAEYTPRVRTPKIPRPKAQCTDADCAREACSRGMCKMHYKRWARARGMETSPSSAWSDTRRSNYHARRARLNGGRNSDKVLIAELATVSVTCPECSHAIDLALAYPHPMSKSIDHTVPLSRGGLHTLTNTTLMHLRCNISKGARL